MTPRSPLGERVAHYRRRAGFTNTQALAAHIGNPSISDSVLRNIESGRKADISTSQLVELSVALGVPVTFLLAPMDRPLDRIDLPNLSDRLNRMSAGELDGLLTGTGPDEPWWPASHSAVFRELRALRGVLWVLKMLDNLETGGGTDLLTVGHYGSGHDEVMHAPVDDERLQEQRLELRRLLDRNVEALARFQDVTWVPRPWLDSSEH